MRSLQRMNGKIVPPLIVRDRPCITSFNCGWLDRVDVELTFVNILVEVHQRRIEESILASQTVP
jgi:hypothetical protein